MIHVNDLVRPKTRLPDDPRSQGFGIVIHAHWTRGNYAGPVDQTITVVWPNVGVQEKWSASGLEVINE